MSKSSFWLLLLLPTILFSHASVDMNTLVKPDSCWTVKIEIKYDTTEVYMVIPVSRQHLKFGGNWEEVCQLEFVKGIRVRKTDNFRINPEYKYYYKNKQVFPFVSFTKQWVEENKVETYNVE